MLSSFSRYLAAWVLLATLLTSGCGNPDRALHGGTPSLVSIRGNVIADLQVNVFADGQPSPPRIAFGVSDADVIGATERGGGEPRHSCGEDRSTGTRQTTDELRNNREATQNRPEKAAPETDPSPGSLVIRLGGQGDVTQTHVVWRSPTATVGYASPLVCEGLIYFTNKVGVVQCVDLQSGEVRWQHRLPGQMWASVVASSGHLFFFCKEGEVVVMKAGAERQVVAENSISVTDIVYGVAAVDHAWLFRSGRSLIKIAATTEQR